MASLKELRAERKLLEAKIKEKKAAVGSFNIEIELKGFDKKVTATLMSKETLSAVQKFAAAQMNFANAPAQ